MTSTKVIGIASKASNISSYVMALDEWAAIPSNPRQRDTERNMQRHIKRGNWGLGKLRDEHLIVAAGRLPSGVMYKLDGHSRTEAWMQGKMERPEYVFVTIINKPDIAAICDSYTLFDNQDAVETTDDKIFGAGREASVEFQSAFMRNRKFGTALMYSEGFTQRKGYDEYGSFKKYMEALQYIDSLNINQRLFTTGITTAAILSLSAPRSNARVRNSVRQLWHDFAKGGVVVLEGKVDAVGALHLVKQGVSKGYMVVLAGEGTHPSLLPNSAWE